MRGWPELAAYRDWQQNQKTMSVPLRTAGEGRLGSRVVTPGSPGVPFPSSCVQRSCRRRRGLRRGLCHPCVGECGADLVPIILLALLSLVTFLIFAFADQVRVEQWSSHTI